MKKVIYKIRNIYNLNPQVDSNPQNKNITKTFRKKTKETKQEINIKARELTQKRNLDNRINCVTKL